MGEFLPSKATEIIERTLQDFFADKEYDASWARGWTLDLGDTLKQNIKTEMNIPRHKIIVQVVIGEQAAQGCRVASKALWDPATDNWASASYSSQTIFAVA